MKKLTGYLTAKLGGNEFSKDLALAMYEAGCDALEIGVPFSDPVADGPVIEAAGQKVLEEGFSLNDLFAISAAIPDDKDLLWMGYFNPFYHYGFKKLVTKAAEVGVSGLIIPDLPFEEAKAYHGMLKQQGVSLIDFVAPTDSKERIRRIVAKSQKFIYLVAYAGITGSDKHEDLGKVIANIRKATDTPVYIGFGVTPENAKEKVRDVDGVIVATVFVKVLMDESLTPSQKISKISELVREIKTRINE